MEVLSSIPYYEEVGFRNVKMKYPSSVETITFTSVYLVDAYFDLESQVPSQVTRININKMHWPVERLISFPYLEILFGLQVHLPCPEEHLIYFQNKQVSKIVIDSEFEFWDDFPFDHCFEHLVTSPTDFLLTSHLVKAKYIEFKESEAVEWTEVFNLLALNIDLERLKIYVNQDLDLSVLSELKFLNTLEVHYDSEESINNVVDYLSKNRLNSLMHVKFDPYGSNYVFLKRDFWSEVSSRLGLKVSPPLPPTPIICPLRINE